MIAFADLSHHQAKVDLAVYARDHDRILLKATQGAPSLERFVDPAFTARWRRAGQLGLARGAYHFAETEASGAAEWAFFADVVQAAGGFGPRDWAVLDAEDNDSATALRRADEFCAEFTAAAVAAGHPTGLLYTGRWYAQPTNIRADDLAPGWRWLHLADYTSGQADTAIELPAGWARTQVAARQFTDRAAVRGVTGGCDYSRVLVEWLGAPNHTEDTMASADVEAILKRIDGVEQQVQVAYHVMRAEVPDGKGGWKTDLATHGEMAVTTANTRLRELEAEIKTLQDGQQQIVEAIGRLQPAVAADLKVTGTLHLDQP
jgi:lysozyme